jgi:acyl dehydratase
MRVRYFEDYDGEILTPGRTIESADIINFAGFTGDWAQMHTNAEYAQKGVFGRRIAHGALTFSISTGLLVRGGVLEETTFIAFYGIDKLRFVKPVFIDDTIYCSCRVLEKIEKGKNGVVAIEVRVINQKAEDVLVYDMKVMVKKKGDS